MTDRLCEIGRRRFSGVGACMALAAALALGGCGGGHPVHHDKRRTAAKTIDIYSSLPLTGPLAGDTGPLVEGIKLALAQDKSTAGEFKVHYQSLNDATAQSGNWSEAQTEANARQAAADRRAVYYIGEFNSAASEVSIPILNQADIAQVSPASTYVGLTTADPGAAAGEPDKYYPAFKRTFLRIVPRDSVEAAADLEAMKQAGCTRVAVAHDSESYGIGQADELEALKKDYDLGIVSDVEVGRRGPNLHRYAQSLKADHVDCLDFAGTIAGGPVAVTDAVHAAIPAAKLFGSHQICTPQWTNAREGGVVASADALIQCTSVTAPSYAYLAATQFLAAYRAAYGVRNPNPYAIYGYEAMKLGLDTISRLGAQGDSRAAVVAALFAIKQRRSVLGRYRFDAYGDTTLSSYGLYKVGTDGDPVYYKIVTPSKLP